MDRKCDASPRRGAWGWRLLLSWLVLAAGGPASAQYADLIVVGEWAWTGDPAAPWARGVAMDDGRILAVGERRDVMLYRGPMTEVREMPGRFLLPGLIDNHTHFNRAGALLLGVNLLAVADAEGLAREVAAAHARLPAGAWMVGGDWGAYEAWARGSSGEGEEGGGAEDRAPFVPHRRMIEPITGSRPVLLSRWDRSRYLANGAALAAAGLACGQPGVDCDEGGTMSGLLAPEAAARVQAVIPQPSLEQRMAEARMALARLRRFGVTGIHDVTPPEQLRVFQELDRGGELTVRVYARPTLDRWQDLARVGIRHGFGNEMLKIGGLKGFVDGIMGNSSARFYEPYLTSGERGSWRPMMQPEGNMLKLLLGADRSGHQPQVHAIGDEAIDVLLDLYQQVMESNPPRERRFRVIHTQVIRGPQVAERMAKMGVIAEVQPYHCIDDMRWMEERIGERARWAYAFKTLHDKGVRLSFGSDWPGTNASWYPANPMLGIYAAVTRQTLDGKPPGGWYPQERIDLETALRAYTINNAWAAGEETTKGSLTAGKLADLVVLDRNPFEVDPAELKDLEVLLTVVGGRVVYHKPSPVER
ncbi:MAG: amidohydrolase [Acidobacteria bacterium]|nr:MAG: amidohydrolase [Acidobacteriota bacterium]